MSMEYADNVNEVQRIGSAAALPADRSADGTESAQFWAGTGLTAWFRIAEAVSRQNHLTLSENDRLFTLMSVAMRDLACCAGRMAFYSTPSDLVRFALATNAGSVNGELAGGSVMSLMTRRDNAIVVAVASNIAHANTAALALKVADTFAEQK